jgi:hypothetical protein
MVVIGIGLDNPFLRRSPCGQRVAGRAARRPKDLVIVLIEISIGLDYEVLRSLPLRGIPSG